VYRRLSARQCLIGLMRCVGRGAGEVRRVQSDHGSVRLPRTVIIEPPRLIYQARFGRSTARSISKTF
jgi:hypothetical protein